MAGLCASAVVYLKEIRATEKQPALWTCELAAAFLHFGVTAQADADLGVHLSCCRQHAPMDFSLPRIADTVVCCRPSCNPGIDYQPRGMYRRGDEIGRARRNSENALLSHVEGSARKTEPSVSRCARSVPKSGGNWLARRRHFIRGCHYRITIPFL
jgi:hypothetical protein